MNDKAYQPFEVDQHITAMSKYYAGIIGSRFFTELRDNGKIMGIKCPKCGRVYCPPRQTCGPCFHDMSENDMVELGLRGTVVAHTTVMYESPVMPRKAPFKYALIQLDGSDTAIAHFVDGADSETVKSGTRVEPVFSVERKGNILDISHFKVAKD